jgi:hypothetical protein
MCFSGLLTNNWAFNLISLERCTPVKDSVKRELVVVAVDHPADDVARAKSLQEASLFRLLLQPRPLLVAAVEANSLDMLLMLRYMFYSR